MRNLQAREAAPGKGREAQAREGEDRPNNNTQCNATQKGKNESNDTKEWKINNRKKKKHESTERKHMPQES